MISSFQLKTTAAVVNYHADALRGANRENSLDEFEITPSAWGGKGADYADLGIGSPIAEKDLTDVLNGVIDGQKIKGGYHKTHGDNYHKPGMDFTFSPGKSISVTCLVGGDDRIRAAHGAAVEKAMQFLEEKGALARVGGQDKATGNLLYAKFEHNTSRTQDPQLHTHVVIANATKDLGTGKWHALNNKELLSLRKEADQLYNQELGNNLKTLGYRTEQGKIGVEIAGFSSEQLKTFSGRSSDIETYLEAKGLTADTASSAQKQVANLATREDKPVASLSELKSVWAAKAAEVGLDASKLSMEKPEPPRVVATRITQRDVDGAVERLVAGMADKSQGFDRLAASVAQGDGSPSAKASLGELSELFKTQSPKTIQDIGKEIRQLDGFKFTSNAQIEKSIGKLLDTGKLSATSDPKGGSDVKYGPEAGEQERRAGAMGSMKDLVVEQAIQGIADRMTQAAKAFDTNMLVSLNTDNPQLKQELMETLQHFKKEQTPRSSQQLAFELRKDESFKYLSNAQVDRALANLVGKGKLQLETDAKGGTRYSPDVGAAAVRNNAFEQVNQRVVDQLVGATVQRQEDAGKLFDAQAKFALKSDDKEQISALYDTLKQLNLEQGPKSLGQIAHSVRNSSDYKYLSNEQVQIALDKLVESGHLKTVQGEDAKSTKYSTDFEASAARYETLRDVGAKTRQPTQAEIGKALGIVVDRMREAQSDLLNTQQELKELSPRADSAQREKLVGLIKKAEASSQLSIGSIRKAIQDELKEFAPASAIDTVVMKAVDNGALHKNLNKFSIETEAQTDARLKEFKGINKEFRDETNAWKSELAKIQRQEVAATRATNRRVAMEEKIVESGRDPLKARASLSAELVNGTVGAVKAIVNPTRTIKRMGRKAIVKGIPFATKQVGGLAVGAVMGAGYGMAKGTAKQVSVWKAAYQGDKAKVIEIKDAARKELRKNEHKAGYYKDAIGNSRRMEISLSSALLVTGMTVLSAPIVSNSTFALQAKAQMLRQIKTTKVSAVEALVAKAVITVGKGVGHAMVYIGKSNQPEKHIKQVDKAHAEVRKAYKEYFSATNGAQHSADNPKLTVAKERLITAHAALDKAYTTMEHKTYKKRHTGLIGDKQYTFINEKVAKYREASSEFKSSFERVESSKNLFDALSKMDNFLNSDKSREVLQLDASKVKSELQVALGKTIELQAELVNDKLKQSHTSPAAMESYQNAFKELSTLKSLAQRVDDLGLNNQAHDAKLKELAKTIQESLQKDITAAQSFKHVSLAVQQKITGLDARELLKLQAAGGKDHIGEQMAATKTKEVEKRAENSKKQKSKSQSREINPREERGLAY